MLWDDLGDDTAGRYRGTMPRDDALERCFGTMLWDDALGRCSLALELYKNAESFTPDT